jgi:hypothetical protein
VASSSQIYYIGDMSEQDISILTEYPLMVISWVDSSRLGSGWLDFHEIADPDPHICVSVGFLVKENELGKVLIPTVADVKHPENRHVHGGIMIPVCSIISERRLTASSEYGHPAELPAVPQPEFFPPPDRPLAVASPPETEAATLAA